MDREQDWIDERDSRAAVSAALDGQLPWADLSPIERRLAVDQLIVRTDLAGHIAKAFGCAATDIRNWLNAPPGVAA